MNYEDLLKRAIEIRSQYDELSASRGVHWNEQNLMSGFVGDVGDLSKSLWLSMGCGKWMTWMPSLHMSSRTVCGLYLFWLINTRLTLPLSL